MSSQTSKGLGSVQLAGPEGPLPPTSFKTLIKAPSSSAEMGVQVQNVTAHVSWLLGPLTCSGTLESDQLHSPPHPPPHLPPPTVSLLTSFKTTVSLCFQRRCSVPEETQPAISHPYWKLVSCRIPKIVLTGSASVFRAATLLLSCIAVFIVRLFIELPLFYTRISVLMQP